MHTPEDYDAALAREAALREEHETERSGLEYRLEVMTADRDALQQRLNDAEQKLGEAYEWGYVDGQNGYSDKEDRDKCVDELLKRTEQSADTTNSTSETPADQTYDYRTDLAAYFGLSYASWLTLPRVLMEAMPKDWQSRIAVLLHEYDDAVKNPPDLGTTVRVTVNGKLVETPAWLINYRHPDHEMIARVMEKSAEGEGS